MIAGGSGSNLVPIDDIGPSVISVGINGETIDGLGQVRLISTVIASKLLFR